MLSADRAEPLRKVLLERQHTLVLEIDLDGYQENVADLQNRYLLHQLRLKTSTPLRRNASASDALVAMSPNSMPSPTMVWAICGRIPEMVHSAPFPSVGRQFGDGQASAQGRGVNATRRSMRRSPFVRNSSVNRPDFDAASTPTSMSCRWSGFLARAQRRRPVLDRSK